MKLLKDVYLVAGSAIKSDESDANAYFIDGGDKLILVDSGGGNNVGAVKAEIIRAGFDPNKIDLIINTHCHFDHTGGNWEFRQTTGVKTAIHQSEVAAIEKNTELTVAAIYNHHLQPCPVDIPLQGNEVINTEKYCLELIHTPGHSPGSICLLVHQDDKKILFAGDALSLLGLPGENAKQLAASLQKLIDLQADIILTGHEEGIIINPTDFLQSYIGVLEVKDI